MIAGFSHLSRVKAQSCFPKEIKKAFSTGDSERLSAYFDLNVEILLVDRGDVYSKAQAELIMKKFFANNSPKSFTVESESEDESSNYAIAQLKTKRNDFRVFIAYREKSRKIIVNQMVISEVQEVNE